MAGAATCADAVAVHARRDGGRGAGEGLAPFSGEDFEAQALGVLANPVVKAEHP